MKQKLTKVGGRVLLIFLISSLLTILASAGVMAFDGASPVRVLPAQVNPGGEFQVTVTFTAPAANFNAIGLIDLCPAGWTVSVDKTWCTPDADVDNNPTPEEVDYIWFGPYGSGAGFTAVYNVQVPSGATVGNYTFPGGSLEYYIVTSNYTEPIGGDTQVEVVEAPTPTPAVGGDAYPVNKLAILAPWIALAVVIAGAVIFFVRRRPAQS
jgi:hypothetical protein